MLVAIARPGNRTASPVSCRTAWTWRQKSSGTAWASVVRARHATSTYTPENPDFVWTARIHLGRWMMAYVDTRSQVTHERLDAVQHP